MLTVLRPDYMRGTTLHLLLCLMAPGCLVVQSSVAQRLSLQPSDSTTYYQKDHLYITTTDELFLENDLTGSKQKLVSAQYEKVHHQSSVRRRGILGWLGWRTPTPDVIAQVPNLRYDLGAFPAPGLYQLRFTRQAGATTLRCNLFAFSGWPGKSMPGPSWISRSAPPGAPQRDLLVAYELLDHALQYAKQDTLHKKWDKVLADALAAYSQSGGPVLRGDFAIVLAPDQPLALFVAQDIKGATPGAALSALPTLLHDLLVPLTIPYFSTQTDYSGKTIPLLTPAEVQACIQTIQSVVQPATPSSPLLIYDAGFCSEMLLREGINNNVLIGAFRFVQPIRVFRQLVLVFRLP